MNLVTCNGTAKVWRSASKNLSYISIFTCRIPKTLRSIVPAITQKKLSNKYLVYEAEWNYMKMNHTIGSKFLNLGEVLLRGIIVCASVSDIDRSRNGWDNLFKTSYIFR